MCSRAYGSPGGDPLGQLALLLAESSGVSLMSCR